MSEFSGKVALVTGSSSGIGEAIARRLSALGAAVVINSAKSVEAGERIAAELGKDAIYLQADISDKAAGERLLAATVERFGRIDILVNNAAHQDSFKDLEEVTDEEWQRTFATNIHAMFYLAKAAVPHMAAGGAIINTASINADMPNPTLLAYATTKGAIQNFTGGLAQMLAKKGIRVNCVAPGPVWTPLIPASMAGEKVARFGQDYPMGRPAQPVELAAAYVMLAEPMASYVSGATVAVTGGKPLI